MPSPNKGIVRELRCLAGACQLTWRCPPWVRFAYGHAVRRRMAAMGIRDHPIAPRSPWQNGHVERLIGSIRRECLDHVVILGEVHLRQVLQAYTAYYNCVRTHLSLHKDAPLPRPVQRVGNMTTRPILGGLHHEYCRT